MKSNHYMTNVVREKRNYRHDLFFYPSDLGNRKRSLHWHSDENRMLEKYGACSNRYVNLYVANPECFCA